jgi:hypothetical protein
MESLAQSLVAEAEKKTQEVTAQAEQTEKESLRIFLAVGVVAVLFSYLVVLRNIAPGSCPECHETTI